MPTKRQVLDVLARDELAGLADHYDVTVRDRRSRAALADGLDAEGPPLDALLAGFSRDRLKDLCRALGLDDSGREKAAIVARLCGGGERPASVRPAVAAGGNGGGRRAAMPAEQLDLPIGAGRLTPESLQRYLWSAADILRGSIDSSDYKNYIFGLVFLKRLSDRFEGSGSPSGWTWGSTRPTASWPRSSRTRSRPT